MADFLVAALGDSIMWGQGLKDEDKFVSLAATKIAKQLGKTPILQWHSAHSGAKIVAGETTEEARRARESFVDAHPTLFKDQKRTEEFIAGKNEDMAVLHGEVPAGFTTIDFQVEWIRRGSPQLADNIELVLINGGANDVNFEEVLDPDAENFVQKFDPIFQKTFYVNAKRLLIKARTTFPNAVIIFTGYYTPFSNESLNDEFEEFLEEMSGKPEMLIQLNKVIGSGAFAIFGGPLSVLGIFHESPKRAARKMISQATLGQSRGLYWSRRAVSELNEDPLVRGPGLIFAHPAFGPANALFASQSFIHDRYEEGELIDPLRKFRREKCPRTLHLETMKALRGKLISFPVTDFDEVRDLTRKLLDGLDGPTSLRQALSQPEPSIEWVNTALKSLRDEIGQVEVCRIASFIHPNEAGARRYAEVIADRHARYMRMRSSLKEAVLEVAGTDAAGVQGGMLSVRQSFGRYGLRLENGIGACMPHATVDSIAVEIVTATDSTFRTHELPGFIDSVDFQKIEFDIGGGRRWTLGLLNRFPPPEFKPGRRDFFTIDTLGDLRLKDIHRLQLSRKGEDMEELWKPAELTLSLNGVPVFHTKINKTIKSGETLTLAYPA